jgi:hypothetical protein
MARLSEQESATWVWPPRKGFHRCVFHPVEGRLYSSSSFKLRLMILGESHYWWQECPENLSCTTWEAIRRGFHSHRFWTAIASLFPQEEHFWKNVLFYNYVQHLLEGPGVRPSKEMWLSTATVDGFKEVLEVYRPNRILVLGKTLWRNMAGSNEQFPNEPPFAEERFRLSGRLFVRSLQNSERYACWYPVGRGQFALTAPIFHPRYPKGFVPRETAAVVHQLMRRHWQPAAKSA